MNKKKILLTITGIILICTGAAFYLNSPPSFMQEEIFIVKRGENLQNVASRLEEKNLIRNPFFFRFSTYIIQRKYVMKGKYRIFKNMTSLEILKRLSKGEILTKKVTIPEGSNLYEIASRLEKKDITSSGKFLYYAFNTEFLSSIGIHHNSAEGYLFPDTYNFPEDSDARDIIVSMNRHLRRKIKRIDLKHVKMNLHEILTLGSLIEEEAKIAKERKYISSVFHNRIRRKMKLDCDPTVRYAVKKFKGRITYSDLRDESPFNTYIHRGLTPTPICSPGLESIKAAASPKNTDFLFFVARNDGSHYFSKNLREHNRAVKFYQRGKRNGFIDNQKL